MVSVLDLLTTHCVLECPKLSNILSSWKLNSHSWQQSSLSQFVKFLLTLDLQQSEVPTAMWHTSLMTCKHFCLLNKIVEPIYTNFVSICRQQSLLSIFVQTMRSNSKRFKIYGVQNFVFLLEHPVNGYLMLMVIIFWLKPFLLYSVHRFNSYLCLIVASVTVYVQF